MESTIIYWGPFAVSMFSLSFSAAAVIGMLLALSEGRRKQLSRSRQIDFVIVILVFGITGGRLIHILVSGQRSYWQNPAEIFRLQDGGISFWGGFACALLALSIWALLRKNSLGRYLDAAAPALALSLAIGRIGYPLQGKAAAGAYPWLIPFEEGLFHPAGVYGIILVTVLFAVIWRRRLKIRYDGELFAWFVTGYAIISLLVEYFREAPAVVWIFGAGQLASLAALLFTLLYMLVGPKNYGSSRFLESRIFGQSSRIAAAGGVIFFVIMLAVFVGLYYLVNGLPLVMSGV